MCLGGSEGGKNGTGSLGGNTTHQGILGGKKGNASDNRSASRRKKKHKNKKKTLNSQF